MFLTCPQAIGVQPMSARPFPPSYMPPELLHMRQVKIVNNATTYFLLGHVRGTNCGFYFYLKISSRLCIKLNS